MLTIRSSNYLLRGEKVCPVVASREVEGKAEKSEFSGETFFPEDRLEPTDRFPLTGALVKRTM